MFEGLLTILPRDVGSATLAIAALASILGGVLWIVGARFSRGIIALLAVAFGAVVGLHLPVWLSWHVDGMGPAVGAAVVSGVLGFVLHRLWVGASLGVLLAAWATLAICKLREISLDIDWPDREIGQHLPDYLSAAWHSLPGELPRIICTTGLICLIVGIAVTALWPRIALVLMWSLCGASLLVAMGTILLRHFGPNLLRQYPRELWAQLVVITLIIAAGSMLQWRFYPCHQQAAASRGQGRTAGAKKRGKPIDDAD